MIGQAYLETAIDWICIRQKAKYMSDHQHDPTAIELCNYFQAVISWVKAVFPKYRREMKGIVWAYLYYNLKDPKFDPKKLEQEVAKLTEDEDVGRKKGIYPYVLTRKEKLLSIRSFSPNQKREAYERQNGICVVCKKPFDIEEMEADHSTPSHLSGKTTADNCQMLCKEDNRRKSGM
jgi:hypothetical protein